MRWIALGLLLIVMLSGAVAAQEAPAIRRDRVLVEGQRRFEERNYPAALAAANTALKLDPGNKEALALKYFSEGRVGPENSAVSNTRRATVDDSAGLPFVLQIKIPPAAPPPDMVADSGPPRPAEPGPAPLLVLAGAASLGFAAFGVSRSEASYESTNGLDDEHPVVPGPYQRLVAGAVLAGMAGAAIYLVGAMAVGMAPFAAVGAEEILPEASAVAPDVEEVVLRRGEILNRVWHSEWVRGSKLSGPEGFSFCHGACLPIHADRAMEGRGLSVGVVNNARIGGLYRVTEDVVANVRQAIGGYDREILLRSAEDFKKLELIEEHISSIPSGK